MKNRVLVLGDLFNLLPDAIVVVDDKGKIVFANAAIKGLLDYEADEIVGKPLGCLIPEEYRSMHEKHFARFLKNGKPTSMSARPLLSALHRSGRESPISISITNLDLDDGRYSVAMMRDAGEIHTEITEATIVAETDALTGIGSRLRLTRVMQAALSEHRPFSLLFLDLKKFKPFNDDYGHEIGDRVLQIVGRRLQAQVRSADLAARLGGDEFVVMLDRITDPELLEQRAAAIAASLSRPFHVGDLSSSIGVNIGAAIHPRDGNTGEELLKIADLNMYQAKQAGLDYHLG